MYFQIESRIIVEQFDTINCMNSDRLWTDILMTLMTDLSTSTIYAYLQTLSMYIHMYVCVLCCSQAAAIKVIVFAINLCRLRIYWVRNH